MSKSTNSNKASKLTEQDVDVLYQKLGDRWFAFSIINDEVFMAPIAAEQIEEMRANANTRSPSENYEAA